MDFAPLSKKAQSGMPESPMKNVPDGVGERGVARAGERTMTEVSKDEKFSWHYMGDQGDRMEMTGMGASGRGMEGLRG